MPAAVAACHLVVYSPLQVTTNVQIFPPPCLITYQWVDHAMALVGMQTFPPVLLEPTALCDHGMRLNGVQSFLPPLRGPMPWVVTIWWRP